MPAPVIEKALQLFSSVAFTNAYGLTETSSTIALLGPEVHREATASSDPSVRARLRSVGFPLPGVELEVRSPEDTACAAGEVGDIFVRGERVAGEYVGANSTQGDWFCTKDRGYVDSEGYLFIEGRNDDTIIRGGENIAPAEIEDVLLRHDAVSECARSGSGRRGSGGQRDWRRRCRPGALEHRRLPTFTGIRQVTPSIIENT